MAPRTYTLRRRAESTAATRARIVSTAVEVYQERGVGGATIGAIAARADVSRGTVLHHFQDADGLLAAAIDHILATIDIPDERVLDGASTEAERIHRFVDATFRFYERSNSWWEVFRRDMERPVVKAGEQLFWASFGRLQTAAIGDGSGDRVVASTVAALVHPGTLWTFRETGLNLEEAIDIIADLITGVVRRRRGERE
ncbi:MAG: TetR/AcrR family transcriptional regulator [Chloroflexi bacterium]|nr:TetR/AcrR family transcriptional regulator [Chloroflexota bacterium]